jgi:hypothetical protein
MGRRTSGEITQGEPTCGAITQGDGYDPRAIVGEGAPTMAGGRPAVAGGGPRLY